MARREVEDPTKTKGSTRTRATRLVGSRHAETGEAAEADGNGQSGSGNAMEAVREVVRSERNAETSEGQSKGPGDKAMDAIREVVEKE